MNIAILMALLPAIFWGSVGLVSAKMGGTPAQQTIGISFGTMIFGMIVMFGYAIPHGFYLGPEIWVTGFFSGLFWVIGISALFMLFQRMGVSLGVPLSTGGQVVMNALLAATLLGEWTNLTMWLVGLFSILLVVAGVVLISRPEKDENATEKQESRIDSKSILYLLLAVGGFVLYFILPNYLAKLGYISNSVKTAGDGLNFTLAILGPQSIGQVIGAILITVFVFREGKTMFAKPSWRNLLTGLFQALGNLFMFLSAANPAVGQTIATTLSQLNIIVGTFGGIYLLNEKKSPRQMKAIIAGTILVVVGAIIIGNIHAFA
ncbi:GRP family sugar transporter [Eupransor demetentiae]|uniref:Glucose uptake protein GlcU (GlcU) n=1 Tax=Eupransor demetentiae TaxID=3109584 RepID=A0ABP0EQE8_9LACO|nr:Glucose uptake protein GlcU (GlcU) [Lactobacillaceae bacterium LMG 33000]